MVFWAPTDVGDWCLCRLRTFHFVQVNSSRNLDVGIFCLSSCVFFIQKGLAFGVFLLGSRLENKVIVQKVTQLPKRVKLVNVLVWGEAEVLLLVEDPHDTHGQVVHNQQVARLETHSDHLAIRRELDKLDVDCFGLVDVLGGRVIRQRYLVKSADCV